MPTRRWAPIAAVSLAALLAPATASAAFPPPTVFPERDFVAVEAWPANTPVRVEVVRNGVLVTTANSVTDADGLAEINHPGGACWNVFTPDILPGDVVRAVEVDGAGAPTGNAAETRTEAVTLNATELAAGAPDVVIHGAAQPDATDVALRISDGTTTVDVPAVPVAGGTWAAAVPAAQLAPLADGPLTVAGTYTLPAGTITGSELTIVKDTV